MGAPLSRQRLVQSAANTSATRAPNSSTPVSSPRSVDTAVISHPREPAGRDRPERRERLAARDVDRKAVQAHPAPHADADGRDLALADPDARQPLAPFAPRPRSRERRDERFFQKPQVAVQVAPAPAKVEDGVADELARAVIGRLAAAMDRLDRDAAATRARAGWNGRACGRWCRPARVRAAAACRASRAARRSLRPRARSCRASAGAYGTRPSHSTRSEGGHIRASAATLRNGLLCARRWVRPMASASAASACGRFGQPEQRAHHESHLRFSAPPRPTTACLTSRGAYS